MTITITELSTNKHFVEAEKLQTDIGWIPIPAFSIRDFCLVKPRTGVCFGAFYEKKLVGVAIASVAHSNNLYLNAIAVRKKSRNKRIAQRLLKKIEDFAKENKYKHIYVHHDPLESKVAHLYSKQGAKILEYKQNHYGMLKEELNAGLPTDRILIRWTIGKTPPRRTNKETVVIDVPIELQKVKKESMKTAKKMRLETRKQFQKYLNARYIYQEFKTDKTSKSQYIFSK